MYLSCVTGEFKKFFPNGEPRTFPGNTFLCHVPKGDFWRFARYVQAQTEVTSFAHKYALLPPSSFHMTVYEGICDQVRRPENWVEGISLEAPLYQITDYFFSQLHLLPRKNNIYIKVVKYFAHNGGISFTVEPYDEATKEYLTLFRSTMHDTLKMNNLNAEGYRFHVSLAYNLIELTPQEQQELQKIEQHVNQLLEEREYVINFGAIELCHFNDMFHFATLSKLEESIL